MWYELQFNDFLSDFSGLITFSHRQWRVGRARQLSYAALSMRLGALEMLAALLLPQKEARVRFIAIQTPAESRHGVLRNYKNATVTKLLGV